MMDSRAELIAWRCIGFEIAFDTIGEIFGFPDVEQLTLLVIVLINSAFCWKRLDDLLKGGIRIHDLLGYLIGLLQRYVEAQGAL